MKKVEAVIFDLDGTVLSNEDEYGEAFAAVIRRYGGKVETDSPQVAGIGVEQNWPILIKKYGIKTDKSVGELASETQREYMKRMDSVKVREGFEDFVEGLRCSEVKIALATSNTWGVVENVLDRFGLENCFDVITTVEEVSDSKPSPDIFVETARKLGVEPEGCVVFEDAESGVNAAKAAGMRVVVVSENGEGYGADVVIGSYVEVGDSGLFPQDHS